MSRKKTNQRLYQFRFLTLGKIVLLSGILVTLFLLGAIIGMRYAVQGRVLETPALVGMSLADAEQLFAQTELNLAVIGRRYDSETPEGAIVSQVPGPGVGIKAGREVRVIVSLGRKANPVPDLRGASLRAARLLAEQNGYEVGRVSEVSYSDNIEDEQIIAQYPPPLSERNVGDLIDVLVHKEAHQAYIMPDMVGWNLNRVLAFLEDSGFEVDRIQYRRHAGAARGAVVRQFPEPGYLLRDDDAINLEVAR
jgi:serine/threonine-protein kinase